MGHLLINFDPVGTPEEPTLVLTKRSGQKLGLITARNIVLTDKLNDAPELSFKVYKTNSGVIDPLWDEYKNFRLIWCKEWNTLFEMYVDETDSDAISKSIVAKKLAHAELSQIMLYGIEINTETDISRDDYDVNFPTVFYRLPSEMHPEASLLNRIMEKANTYEIAHVDSSLMNIERQFTFNGTSLYDAFQSIAEEVGCLFVFESYLNENWEVVRTISAYDMESTCNNCGRRGTFKHICPDCGSTDITVMDYGEDTTVFVSSDELSDEINYNTDTDSVKNCFRVEGGDDYITDTVPNVNPNGTNYVWHITEELRRDMSQGLQEALAEYDTEYDYANNDMVIQLDVDLVTEYNLLVNKYDSKYREYTTSSLYPSGIPLNPIPASGEIVGYRNLMQTYYDVLDLEGFLRHYMFPNSFKLQPTTAAQEVAKLTSAALSPIVVAVTDVNTLSKASADSNVLSIAKAIVRSTYKVEIENSSYSSGVWSGNFKITSFSNAEDYAVGQSINVTLTPRVDTNYINYCKQLVDKKLAMENVENLDITSLLDVDTYTSISFKENLTKFALEPLKSISKCVDACISILAESSVGNNSSWAEMSTQYNPYIQLYVKYYGMKDDIEYELNVREDELITISGYTNSSGNVVYNGLEQNIIVNRNNIQRDLNFENYLGANLWKEFISFRREDSFTNQNYTSDGLSNADLFDKTRQLLQVAMSELVKSATLQHSISCTLNNLFSVSKFKPLINKFAVGNWIRVREDEDIYKLRLVSYTIDYDNIEHINVEFSDVLRADSDLYDQESVIRQAQSMTTSYSSTQRQSEKGDKSYRVQKTWVQDGLNVTNNKIVSNASNQEQQWDDNGILLRRWDDTIDDYEPIQMKIINSTLAVTDDNWETIKTAVGRFVYYDPTQQNHLSEGYGINADLVVGRLILGQQLGIYSENNTMTFDKNGLSITNGNVNFSVNPSGSNVVRITNGSSALLNVTNTGNLSLSGSITATSGSIGNWQINSGAISNGSTVLSSDGTITTNGGTFSNVTVSGAITATSGFIGNWAVVGGALINSNTTLNANGGIVTRVRQDATDYIVMKMDDISIDVEVERSGEIISSSSLVHTGLNCFRAGYNTWYKYDSMQVQDSSGHGFKADITGAYVNGYAVLTTASSVSYATTAGSANSLQTISPLYTSGVYKISSYDIIPQYTADTNIDFWGSPNAASVTWVSSNFQRQSSSDGRLKTNITDIIDNDLLLLERIKLKKYRFVNSESDKLVHYGVIAQEVLTAMAELNISIYDQSIVEEYDTRPWMDERNICGLKAYRVNYVELANLALYGWQKHNERLNDIERRLKELEVK